MGEAWRKKCAKSCATPRSAKAKEAGCWERKLPGSSGVPGLSRARKSGSYERSRSNELISRNDRSRHKRDLRPDADGAGKPRREVAGRAACRVSLDLGHHGNGNSLWLADHAEGAAPGSLAPGVRADAQKHDRGSHCFL